MNNEINNVSKSSNDKVVMGLIVIFAVILNIVFTYRVLYNVNMQKWENEHKINYTKEQIVDFSIGYTDYSDKLNSDNISEFSDVVNYIDKKVGINNYYIYDLYYVNYSKNDGGYIVKIVDKDYYEDYKSWHTDGPNNRYIVIFKKDTDGEYEDYYDTFVKAMEYEDKLEGELTEVDPINKYSVNYSPFFSMPSDTFFDGKLADKSLEETIDYMKNKRSFRNYLFTIDIYVPSDYTEKDCANFFEKNKKIFSKYAVESVTICIMKDTEQLNTLNFTDGSISHYNNYITRGYTYRLEY